MTAKKTISAGLTADEINKFKALLIKKRNEISGSVMSIQGDTLRSKNGSGSNISAKIDDAGADNYEVENTLGMMDSEWKIVREIDQALDRIHNGTYGICLGNGKFIPKARLEAIPWTKYCVEHASMLEKGLVKNNSSSHSAHYDYGDEEQNDDSRDTFRRTAE